MIHTYWILTLVKRWLKLRLLERLLNYWIYSHICQLQMELVDLVLDLLSLIHWHHILSHVCILWCSINFWKLFIFDKGFGRSTFLPSWMKSSMSCLFWTIIGRNCRRSFKNIHFNVSHTIFWIIWFIILILNWTSLTRNFTNLISLLLFWTILKGAFEFFFVLLLGIPWSSCRWFPTFGFLVSLIIIAYWFIFIFNSSSLKLKLWSHIRLFCLSLEFLLLCWCYCFF